MAECRQEDCEFWAGWLCTCAAIEGDPQVMEALSEWMDDDD